MPDIYHENFTIEMCRELAIRTHGKFSIGSENIPQRFAIELMNGLDDSIDVRVWELEHYGYTFDFPQNGCRLRTVVNYPHFDEPSNPMPKLALNLKDFMSEINRIGGFPRYVRFWFKLDFEGKIWSTPKVYVRELILSSYSLKDVCESESKNYVEGVFHYSNFKDFRFFKPLKA